MGFNAFDFSSSPEAFCEETELQQDTVPQPTQPETEEEKRRQHMAEVAKQVAAMGFKSASLWEQSLPGLRQPGGPIRQLPTFGNTAQSLWMPPVHHHRCDDKLQPLQHPPRYYG
ncbi:unnamed protein product [Phytophthora lilii]|uniref:Unnamed protein product n=1 Tax=Phytophthora lilii TaxID=2077276 RepID=A0A9W7D9J3_9STRA|nr:unnamed protein product [Phytophthora lilii]